LVVAHVSSTEGEQWKGFVYAGSMFAVAAVQSILNGQYNKRMMFIGLRVRTALSAAVYKKALVVSSAAKKGTFFYVESCNLTTPVKFRAFLKLDLN